MLCDCPTQGRTYSMKLAQTVSYEHMSTLFGQSPIAHDASPVEVITEDIHIFVLIFCLQRQEGDLHVEMMRFLTGMGRRHLWSYWAQKLR